MIPSAQFEELWAGLQWEARGSRTNDLISPRAGLLYRPVEAVTLPSSGDRFSSLTAAQ